MLRTVAVMKDGRKVLFLGLDDENARRLTSGQPIKVDGAPMGLDTDVVILHGPTMRDVMRQLKDAGFKFPDVMTVGLPANDKGRTR